MHVTSDGSLSPKNPKNGIQSEKDDTHNDSDNPLQRSLRTGFVAPIGRVLGNPECIEILIEFFLIYAFEFFHHSLLVHRLFWNPKHFVDEGGEGGIEGAFPKAVEPEKAGKEAVGEKGLHHHLEIFHRQRAHFPEPDRKALHHSFVLRIAGKSDDPPERLPQLIG